jgi:hypothetical protein
MANTLHIQPMTGTVHTDPDCSLGTARYGTTPATDDDSKVRANVANGRLKGCRRCYNN